MIEVIVMIGANRLKNGKKTPIYICHKYHEETHFKALWDCAHLYDYEIKAFIVLSFKKIIERFKELWHEKKYKEATKSLYMDVRNLFILHTLKNKIVIVGMTPYHTLMNRYKSIFARNKTIYFTSWQRWDNEHMIPKDCSKENVKMFKEIITKHVKGIACVSNLTAEGVAKFNLPIRVVNHAVDIEKYVIKPVFEKKGKCIYLGKLIQLKNTSAILKYMEHNKEADVKIDFVGDVPMSDPKGERIKKEILRAVKQDSRINYLGKWCKEQIQNNLQQYDFLILPSLEEKFGIVLIEALACGVPCIVSNAFGPREIIKDGYSGFVFDLKDKDGFAKAMKRASLLSDEAYAKMCEHALEESKKYSSEHLIKEWVSLIKEVEVNTY